MAKSISRYQMKDTQLQHIVDLEKYPIESSEFLNRIRGELRENSAVLLPNFIRRPILEELVQESESIGHFAYCRHTTHSIFLKPNNVDLDPNHIFNRQVVTSKGCVTTDQIPEESHLKHLYYNPIFQKFLINVLQCKGLFCYQDPLSSITVHYGGENQELGWHFDNSAFAITLLLQKPKAGGVFEYIQNIRVNDSSEFGFKDEIKAECIDEVTKILNGQLQPKKLDLEPGTLVIFRGRDSLHRVSKVHGDRQRILVVFAYNEIPNVRLPDKTMMTFFGRIK